MELTQYRYRSRWNRVLACYFFVLCLTILVGCSRPQILSGIGTSGKYLQGKEEVTERRGNNYDKAIVSLETVVLENPTYKELNPSRSRVLQKRKISRRLSDPSARPCGQS